MLPRTIEVQVHRSADSRVRYWAEVPEIPGCFASADSFDELLAALHEAIELCLGEQKTTGRLLTRVVGVQLRLEADLRPVDVSGAGEPAPGASVSLIATIGRRGGHAAILTAAQPRRPRPACRRTSGRFDAQS